MLETTLKSMKTFRSFLFFLFFLLRVTEQFTKKLFLASIRLFIVVVAVVWKSLEL